MFHEASISQDLEAGVKLHQSDRTSICNLRKDQEKCIIVKTIEPAQQRHKYMIYHYIVWMVAQGLSS